MKRFKLVMISILVIASLALAGCMLPSIVDPDDPVAPVAPVLTLPVAAFSYYPPEYPVQTGSQVKFDGSASYDPDDEIMWGEWDFDNGTDDPNGSIVEGKWVNIVRQWENSKWTWKENPVMQVEYYTFNAVGTYSVTLTVWDNDGNESSVTRNIRVR